MRKLLVIGLCLACAAQMLSCAAGEEPAEGRYRLYISARDPGGAKLSFTWRQLPNEAPRVKIADPAAARFEKHVWNPKESRFEDRWVSETYFIATEPGKYQFEVTVRNEAGDESKKIIQQDVLPPTAAPVAVAGKDREGVMVGEAVLLDGVGSTASGGPGKGIVGWDWRVLKAPGDFKLDGDLLKQRSFEFKPSDPGVYQFELKVFDGRKWSDPARTTVTVLPPAPPPVAAAGKDQTCMAGDTVKVDGSESKAAAGLAITAWEWRMAQTPAPFIMDATLLKQKTFEFKPEIPGVYLLELRVSDGQHWSERARTTITVTAPVPAPVAVAGKDRSCSAGDTVKLDGSESQAAAGLAITEWQWKVVEAPPGFSVDAKLLKEKAFEFTPEAAGVYRFELKVSDGKKWSEPSRTALAVAPPIPPPVAVAGKDQTRTVGEVVRLNGVDSKANGELPISEWEWRVVEAPPKFKLDAKLLKERSFDFKAQEAGVYRFELRVSDSRHWSPPAVVAVTITPGQPPKIEDGVPAAPVELPLKPPVVVRKTPEIKAVVVPGGTVKAGETIVLDGSKSVVEESLKPEFFWRQAATPLPGGGTGPLARQLAPDKSKPFSQARLLDPLNYPVWTCKPEQPGEYKFVLEITTRTQSGEAETVNKTEGEPVVFKVEGTGAEAPPAPPTPPAAEDRPVARISIDHEQVAAGDMVKLDGSKSSGKPGEKLMYVWGPVQSKRYPKSWSGTDGPQVEFKAEEEGEYAVALMVKDSAGNYSEQAQVSVKVGPAGKPPVVKLAKSFECVVGEQVRIEAEATDPDGAQLEYKWSCVDPAELLIPDKLSRNSILVFVPKNIGTYVFKVTVTNAKGLGEAAQTMVGVKDALTRPPTAIIEGPKKPVGTGAKVLLSGARSSDPAKKPLTYLWKQEDGPGGVKVPGNVPGERDKEWEFIPTEQGRYVFSLVVSNASGSKSDPDKFELTVTKADNAPAASIIGPPGGRISLGEQATLDGSTSSDPDNDKLTYKWRKAEVQPKAGVKAGEIELSGVDQEKATVKGVTAGPVRVGLVVNDGTMDSDPAYIDLNIVRPNNPPVAKISGPVAGKTGEVVELSAAESSDPDGDEITYVWSQPSDGGPEIGVRGRDLRKKTLKFKPERSGTYVINLEVVDSGGLKSETVTHKLEVKGLNKLPIAVANRVGNEAVSAGNEVKLTARGSHDPEGAQLKYRWRQVDGEILPPFGTDATVDSEVVNVVPKAAGKYSFELVVNDGELDSKPAVLFFTAKAANKPPVAVIGDVIPCEPGGRVVLDGSASHDPDGGKLEYRWSQVSGPEAKFSSSKARTEAELRKDGEYVFELKVSDGKEWSEPARVAVKTRAPGKPPVAAFVMPEVRIEENGEAVLDASASTGPDNGQEKTLTYHWKQISGPAKIELASAGAKARLTPKKAGNYVFQVKVSDGKAESAPAEIKVEVLKAGTLPVAVAVAKPNPLKAAQKGNKADPNILELNGEKSRPGAGGAALTYQWQQVVGEDLKLRPSDLAKGRVGLRIFRPGTYRFMLVVSDGQNRSAPAYVDVEVIEGEKAPETGASTGNPKPETPNPKSEIPNPKPDIPNPKSEIEDRKSKIENPDSPLSPQLQALAALAGKPEPEAEKTLIEALSNANPEVRSTAAVALSKRGPSAVPALIGVLETGSAAAKKEALFALKEITHESYPADAEKWKQWRPQPGKQAGDSSADSATK